MSEQYYQEEINPQRIELVNIDLPRREKEDKILEANIEDLAHAVSLWLNYQTTVSSSANLLHEASFRYPVAEYLERKVHSVLELEEKHPIFENRPTDFQWKQNGKNYYLECKYVKYGYTNKIQEFQRYIDDICRLYYCITNDETDMCYFLVCGKKEDVEKCFVESKLEESDDANKNERNINKSRYNNILDFNSGGVKEISFDSRLLDVDADILPEEGMRIFMNKAYRKFMDDYKSNLPANNNNNANLFEESISLRLINRYKALDDELQYVYIWQVQRGKIEKMDDQPIIAD